jgi:hypothetical protein
MRRRAKTRRERLALRLPFAVLEFPFEVFVGVYGLLAALAIVLGGAVPASLDALLPPAVVYLWGCSLGLGGATILYGLHRRFAFVIAMGLRLVAGALTIFVGAALWFAYSVTIIPSALLILFVAALAGFRSFYLRTNALFAQRISKGE